MDTNNKQQRLKLKQHLSYLKNQMYWQYALGGLFAILGILALINFNFVTFIVSTLMSTVAIFLAYKKQKNTIPQYDEILHALREGISLDAEQEEYLEVLLLQKPPKSHVLSIVLFIVIVFFVYSITMSADGGRKSEKSNQNDVTATTMQPEEQNMPPSTSKNVTTETVQPIANTNSKGWQPEKACDFLEDTSYFSTREHMKYQDSFGDGEYMCASKEWELPSEDSLSLPNDLSYRVLGTKDTAKTLKLVFDIHQSDDKSAGEGTMLLINYANELSLKATGKKLPDGIPQNLLLGKSKTVQTARFKHSVINEPYPNGKGYYIYYVLTKK